MHRSFSLATKADHPVFLCSHSCDPNMRVVTVAASVMPDVRPLPNVLARLSISPFLHGTRRLILFSQH